MRLLALLALATLAPGCALAQQAALGLVYTRADLPEANLRPNLAYVDGPEADVDKHRLDLFLPLQDSVRARPGAGSGGWPTVVFVHGGGWTEGDRALTFGGQDVYGNIGRFFAARGIGAATVSYRLLPNVPWQAQVEDVARAVAWVHRNVGAYGGDPEALFVMGHSAGAQLAARVALDPDALGRQGVSPGVVCGAIPVSGAALDLTDRRSFELARDYNYYGRRFGPPRVDEWPREAPAEPAPWQTEASPARFARADAPPFLLLYAGGESAALQRQSELLAAALREAGAEAETVVVPGLSHTRIVPTLSRPDQTAGPAMLRFVRAQTCR